MDITQDVRLRIDECVHGRTLKLTHSLDQSANWSKGKEGVPGGWTPRAPEHCQQVPVDYTRT